VVCQSAKQSSNSDIGKYALRRPTPSGSHTSFHKTTQTFHKARSPSVKAFERGAKWSAPSYRIGRDAMWNTNALHDLRRRQTGPPLRHHAWAPCQDQAERGRRSTRIKTRQFKNCFETWAGAQGPRALGELRSFDSWEHRHLGSKIERQCQRRGLACLIGSSGNARVRFAIKRLDHLAVAPNTVRASTFSQPSSRMESAPKALPSWADRPNQL